MTTEGMHLGVLRVHLSLAVSPGVSSQTPECPLISLSTQFLAVWFHLPGYGDEEIRWQLLCRAVGVCPPWYLCPEVYVCTLLSRTCLILTDVFQCQYFAFIILHTFGFGVALQIMAGWI